MLNATDHRTLGPDSWQFKAIAQTRAHQTQLGMILCAALNINRGHKPRLATSAVITSDGEIWTKQITKAGDLTVVKINTVIGFRDDFRRLADQLKLVDADREAMFKTLREWIAEDARANKDVKL